MQVYFCDFDCEILMQRHADGSPRLQLWNQQAGPVATATVELSDCGVVPKQSMACVKTGAENTGLLGKLLVRGAIAAPVAWLQLGHGVAIALCPLSPELLGYSSVERN